MTLYTAMTAAAIVSAMLAGSVVADANMTAGDGMCASGAAMTQACEWSSAECTDCASQCVINQALVEFDTDQLQLAAAAAQEKVTVCTAAGSVSFFATLFAGLADAFGDASTSRKLSGVNGVTYRKVIAAAKKAGLAAGHTDFSLASPRRALLQDADVSFACPSDADIDVLMALNGGEEADGEDTSDDSYDDSASTDPEDALLDMYLENPEMIKAYVKANCSTVDVDAEAVSSLITESLDNSDVSASADVSGSIKFCGDKDGAFMKTLQLATKCNTELAGVTPSCFADEEAVFLLNEECLKTSTDIAGYSTSAASQFSKNALAIHTNCQTRTEATCEDAATDAALSGELSALTSAKGDLEKASGALGASVPAFSAAAFLLAAFVLA